MTNEPGSLPRDNFFYICLFSLSGYEKNFHKETLDTVDPRDVGYDYDSVMHYGEFFFTREPGMRTLEPLDPSASIGQRIGLSEKDVEQGNLLYDCTGIVKHCKPEIEL